MRWRETKLSIEEEAEVTAASKATTTTSGRRASSIGKRDTYRTFAAVPRNVMRFSRRSVGDEQRISVSSRPDSLAPADGPRQGAGDPLSLPSMRPSSRRHPPSFTSPLLASIKSFICKMLVDGQVYFLITARDGGSFLSASENLHTKCVHAIKNRSIAPMTLTYCMKNERECLQSDSMYCSVLYFR